LFANSVAPTISGATIPVRDLLEADTTLRDRLEHNARYLRNGLQSAGFELKPGDHPIIPVMVHEAEPAQRLSQRLLELGVDVVGVCYPVVPQGQARVRGQVSAAQTQELRECARAVDTQAGRELGLI